MEEDEDVAEVMGKKFGWERDLEGFTKVHDSEEESEI
jgi:hypothetical protein